MNKEIKLQELQAKRKKIAQKYQEIVEDKSKIDNRITEIKEILLKINNLKDTLNIVYKSKQKELLTTSLLQFVIILTISFTLYINKAIIISILLLIIYLTKIIYNFITLKNKVKDIVNEEYKNINKDELMSELAKLLEQSKELNLKKESLANLGNLTENEINILENKTSEKNIIPNDAVKKGNIIRQRTKKEV